MSRYIQSVMKVMVISLLAYSLSGCGQGVFLIHGDFGSVEVRKTHEKPHYDRNRDRVISVKI